MKQFSNYYQDGKIKYDGKKMYCYKDKNNYLFSKGIYETETKEEDLPDYFVKIWFNPIYKYISLKNIKDIHYRPNFFTNHWRKDDFLYISYKEELILNDRDRPVDYDVLIYGPEIDNFIKRLTEYDYNKNKINKIKKIMNKKDKWFNYWKEHNWDGNYSNTSEETWKEILDDNK